MTIRRLTVIGFRGAPIEFAISLDHKSRCILAENGHGKTTIVDALEFWSSGDVRAYHREGYGLDALVNVDAAEAVVTAEGRGFAKATRRLAGSRPSPVERVGPGAVGSPLPTPLPILRHRTMAEFMDKSPGDKQKQLLDLLGLSELTDFRAALVTAANAASRAADEARRTAESEARAYEQAATADPVARAEELRVRARLSDPIQNEEELQALEVALDGVEAEVDRLGSIAAAAQALEELDLRPIDDWNEGLRRGSLAAERSLSTLLAAGQDVLAGWSEDTCPLCRQPKERAALTTELAERAAELAAADREFEQLEEALRRHQERVATLGKALGPLERSPPAGGWPEVDVLTTAIGELREHYGAIVRALKERRSLTDAPAVTDLRAWLGGVRESAVAGVSQDAPRALAELVGLRDQARRARSAATAADRVRAVSEAVAQLLEIATDEIQRAIDAALAQIGGVVADYYGRLVDNTIYSGVELRQRNGGGVEFRLIFDRRHEITPPQRVVSESQLNALGLALFLARLKMDANEPWRTLVLDDVVNSFDANHRGGLARLLAEEFDDWQVLLFTHDRVFAQYAKRVLRNWQFSEIVAWTPTGGPVLASGHTHELLEQRLQEGRPATELGGLARVALEQALSTPLERLAFPIRYDPLGRYSAQDLLQALKSGLKKANAEELRRIPVLDRIEGASYFVNLAAHDRPGDQGPGREELTRMLADLEELRETFVCERCQQPVWAAAREGGRHHQCHCAALAV